MLVQTYLPATAERSFRIFRATPRRSAIENARRFVQKIGLLENVAPDGSRGRAYDAHPVTYDGQEMIAVNYLGKVPVKRVKLAPAKRFNVASDGSRWQA
jgi:hypothetical protein